MDTTREPVVLINSITACIEAIILLCVAFGLNWTPEQIAALMTVVVALGTVAKTILVRSRVTPLSDPRDNNGNLLTPEGT